MARDTRARFDRAMREMEPAVRRAFLDAIADVRSVAQLQVIEAAIERGDVAAVLQALRLGPGFFAPLDGAIESAFRAGGAYAISSLPRRNPATGAALVVRFQGRHERAEQWIKQRSGGLISDILEDQRAMIRETLAAGLNAGKAPRSLALELVGRVVGGRRSGGLIGLTSAETGYVRNLRVALADPSTASDYFDRAARDRRFDRTVAKSIRTGVPLTQGQIDQIAGRYADRLLYRRGERIARTETIAALHAGRQEGWGQIIDSGAVDASAVTKTWRATGDERTRVSHRFLSGQVVRHGEAFTNPLTGARMLHPGDTSLGAGAADTINCRCWMETRVDWLAMAV